jgi:hypothetical protein
MIVTRFTQLSQVFIVLVIDKNTYQACDESGIYAENLTNCKHIIAPILTRTFNKILEIRKVPEVFKTGILFPIVTRFTQLSQVFIVLVIDKNTSLIFW